MVKVVLGIGVVVVASCQNSYGVNVAVCACFGEGVEEARSCRFDRRVIGGGWKFGSWSGLAAWLTSEFSLMLWRTLRKSLSFREKLIAVGLLDVGDI